METSGSFFAIDLKRPGFHPMAPHFSGFHCLFHLFLLFPPCTIFTLGRKCLLLSGAEQVGTPPTYSAHQRGLFQRWEVLRYL